jgi:molybdopterin molybdotransferase
MNDATAGMPEAAQRIARLTPLADVLARIDALVGPVEPREVAIAQALGRVIVGDLAAGMCPPQALALRDGWAVDSDLTADAGPYAPVPLRAAARIEVGQPLPHGADAVAEVDAVEFRDGRAAAIAAIARGEGVLPAGADAVPSSLLLPAGKRLNRIGAAVLGAAGISRVIIRAPSVRVLRARPGPDAVIDAAAGFVARAVDAEGGAVLADQSAGDDRQLEDALREADVDAVIAIGGTGLGRNDASVSTLARLGRVEVHGIALSPGETAAFGFVGARPVLLLPGRLDAALAVWLVIGRRLLARLSGSSEEPDAVSAKLTRKAASNPGMAELIPVRCHGGTAEPLGTGYLSLQALAQADGWILVPADREGYPAAAEVMVRPWQ